LIFPPLAPTGGSRFGMKCREKRREKSKIFPSVSCLTLKLATPDFSPKASCRSSTATAHSPIQARKRANYLATVCSYLDTPEACLIAFWGHILEARGYDGAYSFIDKGSAALEPGNPLTDLLISDTEIKLLYGNLDIGGYGKGWLIDKLAFALADRFGVQQFLINGGGDLYVTHQNNQPVEIYLENPMRPGTLVGSTKLMNRGFACSSPHKRSWTNTAGIDQNHIVTNTTMRDATYVTASTAVAADAFATTFLLTSRAETARLVADHQLEIL